MSPWFLRLVRRDQRGFALALGLGVMVFAALALLLLAQLLHRRGGGREGGEGGQPTEVGRVHAATAREQTGGGQRWRPPSAAHERPSPGGGGGGATGTLPATVAENGSATESVCSGLRLKSRSECPGQTLAAASASENKVVAPDIAVTCDTGFHWAASAMSPGGTCIPPEGATPPTTTWESSTRNFYLEAHVDYGLAGDRVVGAAWVKVVDSKLEYTPRRS